jgi:outer membrane protein TolC
VDARRIGRLLELGLALILVAPQLAEAQTRLSVAEAVARATTEATAVRALVVAEREARARLEQARAGLLPTAEFTESWQRGTQPVFVFSSLLAQRHFADSTAAIDALSRSTAVSNYRSALTVDAPIFDATTRAAMRSAEVGVDMAAVQREAAQHDLAASVVAAYGAVVNAVAMLRVVAASLESARADLMLAGQRRDQGLVTDADVLQVQLHVAATREREIRAKADETVARARLNQVMGARLDEMFVVDDLMETAVPDVDAPDAETVAVQTRPEARLAALNESLADAARDAARAAFLPRISAVASWEANGGQWNARSSGWTTGVVARVNLFRGFADRARLAEATELQRRRLIERESVDTAVRVDIRETRARLDAARATVDVAEAAVVQAVESHRIVRDRYEGGLTDVSALLRAAEGVQTAQARRVTARVDVIVATAAWRRATGR